MSKREDYQKIVDDYVEQHKDDKNGINITVDAGANYLIARSYLEGYNDGMFEAIDTLKSNSDTNTNS